MKPNSSSTTTISTPIFEAPKDVISRERQQELAKKHCTDKTDKVP